MGPSVTGPAHGASFGSSTEKILLDNNNMKVFTLINCLFALLAAATLPNLRAEDVPAAPGRKPDREEFKNLTPEERAAKIKEWREKNGGPVGEALQKKREELKNLTPEEREAKRKEFRERFDKQVGELRQKKADGTITAEESKRLERMEQIIRRFEQGRPDGDRPPGSPKPRGEGDPEKSRSEPGTPKPRGDGDAPKAEPRSR